MRTFSCTFVEKIKTHVMSSKLFFTENRADHEKSVKYCRNWQATDDNMAHAHFTLDS
jgi:hypothetical protein